MAGYAPYEKNPCGPEGCSFSIPSKPKSKGNKSALEDRGNEAFENHELTEEETSTEDVLSMMRKGQL